MESIELKNTSTVQLKNRQLAESANVIFTTYNKASKMARDTVVKIAKELGKVQQSKSYEEDGFKSAADFAERYCGLKHSQAYNFAAWGRAILEPDCPQEIKDMSPSNYAEVKSLGYDKVKDAVGKGEITADMTQDALKAYAKEHKEAPDKPKVLKQYAVFIPSIKKELERATEADIEFLFPASEGYDAVNAPAKEGEVKRKVYISKDLIAVLVIFKPVNEVNTKSAETSAKTMETARSMAKIGGLTAEQINQILGTAFTQDEVDSWK